MTVTDDFRTMLIKLCRSSRTRTASFEPRRPTKWSPTSLTVPGTQDAFTDAGAWEFIACCIEEGVEIEIIILDKPPNKKGYVMLVPGNNNDVIYIKLQVENNKVIGRSFHASE